MRILRLFSEQLTQALVRMLRASATKRKLRFDLHSFHSISAYPFRPENTRLQPSKPRTGTQQLLQFFDVNLMQPFRNGLRQRAMQCFMTSLFFTRMIFDRTQICLTFSFLLSLVFLSRVLEQRRRAYRSELSKCGFEFC